MIKTYDMKDSSKKINLDSSDREILRMLQEDARLSSKAIAQKLGKSLNPIYERIRKLEKYGFIKKYVALLDRTLIDRNLVSFTNVQLKEHSHEMIQDFERTSSEFTEVMELNHITGRYDYLLKVVTQDMNEYQNFLVNKLSKVENIAHVESSFVMTEVKNETKYSI